MLEKETIIEYIKKQYDFLNKVYNKDRILGLFVLGKINYGFSETIDDIQTLMIYLPSLEEVCCTPPIETHLQYSTKKTIQVVDIRKILN